jgi:hypothetical protein
MILCGADQSLEGGALRNLKRDQSEITDSECGDEYPFVEEE